MSQRSSVLRVAASPLNVVKLELGLILGLGAVAWLFVGGLGLSPVAEVGLLGLYGFTGMAWLVVRARRVLGRVVHDGEDPLQPPLAP